MKQSARFPHQRNVMMTTQEEFGAAPDFETIRQDALLAGGVDLMSLRFRVVEYEKSSGDLIGVAIENAGFRAAFEKTQKLIARNSESHFCLEPVGFIQ